MKTRRPKILIVEDSFLLAELLGDFVEDCGYEPVGPAYTLERALQLARTTMVDAAVLDIDLHGDVSFPVGLALVARGIPFVFATGYSKALPIPVTLRGAPLLHKPYPFEDLQVVLGEILRVPQLSWAW
jgi:two-component system, chemotaxis family, sensor kinase Cph1